MKSKARTKRWEAMLEETETLNLHSDNEIPKTEYTENKW